jgi:hypothetical protein
MFELVCEAALMGTRSLTVFVDEFDSKEIVVLYRQFDGYPDGHGRELAEFLKGIVLVNGIPMDSGDVRMANGMACLTAQVIAHFKTEVGGFYLHAAGTHDCWEEWIYTVYPKKGKIYIRCEDAYAKKEGEDAVFYDGPADRFSKETNKGQHKQVKRSHKKKVEA